MTEQQKLNEIITLFTFLQIHIQNYVNQSFTDLTFSLENVIKDYLNVFEKATEQYENINSLKHNYPAIDLINKSKNIALQITTNADLRKVKKTLETYNRHKIVYSNLIVIGFVKSSKASIPKVEIKGVKYLIDLAKFGSSAQKDEVYEILKNQIPWTSLSPRDDKMSFEVVFDVINRSAIRDYTVCEGDFDKMANGLSEVKEIITTGVIKGKNIRAKALVEYTNKINTQLSEIELYVSQIIQICNSNKNERNSTFLCLSKNETDEIDDLKEKIINKTNKLAKELKLDKEIVPSKRW
ncbi:SMEK domain-containing protein [Flavobacterium pectinovorum]|uniref:SMEK domain-containing protein n=1 Tax=Flavobacterium pectinovorum TaxID=29533 RepID=UPI0026601CF6|nr:SMEK domain-containing protein [Flavobacterium pectinovorum]WKL50437.1 SMEK domain-containing protein [Flavobacterium pectinovorum]